jgi:undecaprenyl-diphosphatase
MNKDKRTSWARMPFAKIAARVVKFFGWRLLIGLILAVAALIFFGWLASEIFEGETKIFDETIRQAVNQIASPGLTKLMIFISFIGSAIFLVPLGVIVLIIFLRLKWRRAAVLFVITMAGEIILDLTLKRFYGRVRPVPFFDYPLPSSYSFPSGHALGSFCFYGILAWLITTRLENRTARIVIRILAAILIFLMGFSRIYLGVHYPSDVVGGYSAALVWTVTVGLGDFFFNRRKVEKLNNKR